MRNFKNETKWGLPSADGFHAARFYSFEQRILSEAVRFAVTVYRGGSIYESKSAYSQESARELAPSLYDAKDQRPVMIYAITENGTSALIETYAPPRRT